MAGQQAADIGDLVTSTLRDLGPGKWTDLSYDLQGYHTVKRLMKGNRIKTFDSGYEFQWQVMVASTSSARSVGLGAEDVVNIQDTMISGNHPFRHQTFNFAFEEREPAFNRGKAEIYDLVASRRHKARVDYMKLIEDQAWSNPASTSDDIHGIPYWIVKASGTPSFQGGAASGYTTVGGINPTTYTQWKNWTGQYTLVTAEDLVVKLDDAMDYTAWMPPVDGPSYNTGDQYEMYTTQSVRGSLKRIAMDQNDDLGFDLDPAYGQVMFRRTPIVWIPQILGGGDTTNPIYGVNWGVMKWAVLRGWWMKQAPEAVVGDQHTVRVVHTDCTCNLFTMDRRRHFVLYV